jgi:hypothetical protein
MNWQIVARELRREAQELADVHRANNSPPISAPLVASLVLSSLALAVERGSTNGKGG